MLNTRWSREKGQLLFKGHKVSALQGELWSSIAQQCEILNSTKHTLNMMKMPYLDLCFDQRKRNTVNLRHLTADIFTTSSQSCNQNPGNEECVTQYNLCYYILKFPRKCLGFLSGFENQRGNFRENGSGNAFLLLFTSDLASLMKVIWAIVYEQEKIVIIFSVLII